MINTKKRNELIKNNGFNRVKRMSRENTVVTCSISSGARSYLERCDGLTAVAVSRVRCREVYCATVGVLTMAIATQATTFLAAGAAQYLPQFTWFQVEPAVICGMVFIQ